jgi:hypothetical protein
MKKNRENNDYFQHMWVPRKCGSNMTTRKKENEDLETLLVVGLKII